MAEDAACGQLGNLVANVVTIIGRQFKYVFYYKTNVRNMERLFNELEAKRTDMGRLIEEANNNNDIVGSSAMLWLENVGKEKEVVDSVLLGVKNIGEGCLNEWCLHLPSRYGLSRKATKQTEDLIELIAQGNNFTVSVSFAPPPLGMVPKPIANADQIEAQGDVQSGTISNPASVMGSGIASTSVGSFGELKSRSAALEDIMEAVRDVNIHTIGVCGMGGVGKTYLINKVEEWARVESLFDWIAFAVVSHDPNLEAIQLGIANFLGLKFKEDTLTTRARRLNERLNRKGKDEKPENILIILDDLWEKLDLKEVGIHYPNKSCSCKIIFTSRYKNVCHQMEARRFDINSLCKEEAWSLFQSSLRSTISYPTIGHDIVAECGGLPMAIKTIAALLADKEKNTWSYVLHKLQSSSLQGEYKKVYTVFQLSYDKLDPQEVKDVFLLFCLFPEDSVISIEDIARYGMGLKVFGTIENLHEARVTAHVHVEALRKLNLLLDGPNSESVKMHDLVRDFGISIASGDNFMVRLDTGLKHWPVKDAQERYTHISMHCGELSELPTGLNYPSLKLLHLISRYSFFMHTSDSLFRFPKGLDEVCGGVRVLDLQHFNLESYQPIECLPNLISLSLSNCSLSVQDLSSIGNIKQLEMLSFANSNICELPGEIGKLTRLRLLDLTGCKKLKKVSPGVLLGLTFLEELYMRGTSIVWAEEYSSKRGKDQHCGEDFDNDDEAVEDYEDDKVLPKNYASFADLEQLCNLVVIEIHVPYQFVPVRVMLEKLEKFKISAGDEEWEDDDEWEDDEGCMEYDPRPTFQNYLSLKGGEIKLYKEILKALCKKTEFLYLSVKDLVNLRNEVDENDLTRLSTLVCQNCDNLASVFDQSFKISSSPTSLPHFRNLRDLTFVGCGKLKNVFAPSIARSFINLEDLRISQCSSIEEIISAESSGDQDEQKPFEFLKLKRLYLKDLPNFVCFSKAGDHEVHLPQLQVVELEKLPKLSSIDHVRKAVSNLGHQHQQGFHNLKRLEIVECYELKRIFSMSMISCMAKLEVIKVHSCPSLEEIFSVDGGEDHDETNIASNTIKFPKLETLDLCSLESLVSFCRSCNVALPNLQKLNLIDVPKLPGLYNAVKTVVYGQKVQSQYEQHVAIFPANMVQHLDKLCYVIVKGNSVVEVLFEFEGLNIQLHDEFKALPQLWILKLIKLPKLREIWRKVPPHIQGFYLLRRLEVEECNSLTYLFTTSMAKALVGLRMIRVSNCNNLESIVSEDEENESPVQQSVLFPQLSWLNLENLPKLSTIAPLTYRLKTSWLRLSCAGDISFADIIKQVLTTELYIEGGMVMEKMTTVFQGTEIPDLEYITIVDCAQVEQLFDLHHCSSKPLPDLKYIHLTRLPKLTNVWKSAPGAILDIQKLEHLTIEGCNSLRHLITSSQANSFVKLAYLTVTDCNSFEAIVLEEEVEEEVKQVKLFPSLRDVTLKNLPKLLTRLPEHYTFGSPECKFTVDDGLLELLK